jgi:hypothetical protein
MREVRIVKMAPSGEPPEEWCGSKADTVRYRGPRHTGHFSHERCQSGRRGWMESGSRNCPTLPMAAHRRGLLLSIVLGFVYQGGDPRLMARLEDDRRSTFGAQVPVADAARAAIAKIQGER